MRTQIQNIKGIIVLMSLLYKLLYKLIHQHLIIDQRNFLLEGGTVIPLVFFINEHKF